jgi:hypothetical protein
MAATGNKRHVKSGSGVLRIAVSRRAFPFTTATKGSESYQGQMKLESYMAGRIVRLTAVLSQDTPRDRRSADISFG